MVEEIINVNKLCCKMGKNYLLKDVSWQVKKGERWVIYGMNGSGKTTLLSIIAGYKHFTRGTVKVYGEEFCNENILAMRKQIGFVSSSFFDRHYTKESVLDIVLSGLTGGLSLSDGITLSDATFAKKLLRNLNLEEHIYKQFDMLSKGQRQNVLIARALINKPELLILDEPMNGLDVYNREYLIHTLEELSDKMTIIYVTHYVEEISPMFTKCLFLKRGQVFAEGETKQLFQQETLCRLLGHEVELKRDVDGYMKLGMQVKSTIANLL